MKRLGGAVFDPCPPDGASDYAEISEPGRPPRHIGARCVNETPTFQIISAAAYPSTAD